MANIVQTCPGALSTYDQNNFGGAPFQSPNTLYTSPSSGGWNNVFGVNASGGNTDVGKLYDSMLVRYALLSGVMKLLVFGHSRGAQMIYKLFRERMASLEANFDPDKVLFVGSGNPECPYNGRCINDYANYPPVYPGGTVGVDWGLPAGGSGDFRFLDIARQYDIWRDHPTDLGNTTAEDYCTTLDLHSAYDGAPHLDADGMPVNWDDWSYFDVGNTTFMWAGDVSKVSPPPLSPMARLHGGFAAKHRIRQTQYEDSIHPDRLEIEVAYERPIPVLAKVTG